MENHIHFFFQFLMENANVLSRNCQTTVIFQKIRSLILNRVKLLMSQNIT